MKSETPQHTRMPTTLPATARTVLVFAEHTPTAHELEQAVAELRGHDDVAVTVVLHHDPVPRQERVDEHGGVTHDHLAALVEALAVAGHPVSGELVSGDVEHALLTEIRLRRADAVILLPGRHLLAHLVHRDLEHRLRHDTEVPVLTVTGRGSPHLV